MSSPSTPHIKRNTDKQDLQGNNPESDVSILLEYGDVLSVGKMCPKFCVCVVVASVTIRRHRMHPPSDSRLVNHLCVLTVLSF